MKKYVKANYTLDVGTMMNLLVENGVATDDEIALVCAIDGTSKETLENILYVRTGLRDFYDLIEEA